MKVSISSIKSALCLLCLATALPASAQGVYSANLTTSPAGGVQLESGRFWFHVDAGGEVDFQAVVFSQFSQAPTSMAPVLTVPGSSVHFSSGDAVRTEFRGLYWDHNPFAPFTLPITFDEEGNPYLIDAPVIRYGDLYTGHFTLPAGFEAELRNGRGLVRFGDFLAGTVTLVPVPEPASSALIGLAVLVAAVILRRRR